MYNSSKKLQLRRIKQDDLYVMFEARNDLAIYKWCGQNAPLHWNNHITWYSWQAADPTVDYFVMENASGFVGVCGLKGIDLINSRAEFNIYVHPKRQKTGLGEDGLMLLLEHGFSALGLNRIWGEVLENNEKALNLFRRMGFCEEGIRREYYFKDGKFIDSHLISLDRTSFYSALGLEKDGAALKKSGPKPRTKVVDFTKVRPLEKARPHRGL